MFVAESFVIHTSRVPNEAQDMMPQMPRAAYQARREAGGASFANMIVSFLYCRFTRAILSTSIYRERAVASIRTCHLPTVPSSDDS